MIWYQNLYIGQSIKRKAMKIKWKIRHNAGQLDIYVLTLASNPQNLIDLIPSTDLLQKHYPRKNLVVIGLAKGYDEAAMLAGEIISEVLKETRTTNVRDYIQKKIKA